jgi:hypothetical protein
MSISKTIGQLAPTIAAAVMAELKAQEIRRKIAHLDREILAFYARGSNHHLYTVDYFKACQQRREELQKQLQML